MSKGRNKRMTKKEFEEQFEAFLKESASSEESLDSSRINKFLEKPKREGKPWWLDDEDDDDVKVGTGKSFLKKKSSDSQVDKPEQTFSKEKDEKPGKADRQKNKQQGKSRTKPDVSISRDSLEDISEKSEEDFADRPRVHVPGLNLDNPTKDSQDISLGMTGLPQKLGMDTLDELADKEKFFKDLERNAHGTIDYSRLNQELSVTGTTMSPDVAAKTAATLAVLKDVEDDELDGYDRPGAPEPPPLSEARSVSEQKPSLLSKVSLMDSLESTMNTTTSPQVGRDTLQGAKSLGITMEEKGDEVDAPFTHSVPETFKTGTGFIGTNTSQEIEALHKALREVGMSTTLKNESLFELSEDKDTADLVQKLLSGEIGNKTGKQRPLDDILKELEVLQKKAKEEERKQADVDLPSRRQSDPQSSRIVTLPEELRGFALSPVQQDSPGFDYSHTEDTEMYQPVTQVSVTEKNKGKKNTARDEKSHKEKTDKSEKSKDVKGQHFRSPRSRDSKLRHSLSPRSRSTSPRKPDIHPVNETMKNKYSNIKSSGYGVTSPSKVVREGLVTKQKSLKMTKNRSASKSPRRMHDPKRSQWRATSEADLKNEEEAVKDGEDTDAQGLSELEKERVKKADNIAKSAKTAGKPMEKTGKTWSPADIARQKVQGTHSPKQKRKQGVLILDSQLQASVDSFAHYIKNHFTGDNVPQVKYSVEEPSLSASWKHKDVDLDLVRDWQERWKQENQAKLQVEAELMMAHREFEKKLEASRLESDQEIFQLKQDNFVLNAKLEVSDQDSVKKKVLNGETLEGVNKDQMALLEKELKEQETLLAGYQQENKRLYDEMKNIKKQSKQTEERMFKENQKLLSEMTSLRTELEKKAEEMRDKVVTTGLDAQQKIAVGDARFTGVDLVVKLEAELRETKISMNNLKREMNILVQSKVELEKHIEKLVTEREELEKKLKEAKTMKSEEATDLEKKYEEEIGKLKKKLKWYMENQELLDEGAKNLRLKGDEIQRLKLRIEELQTETGKRMEESKLRARERAADAKKIQDLQRQVKEMEQILKKRNPNALPTLMMAAAAAAAASEPNIANKTPYVDVLEKRVKKLEAELDVKDGEADQLLRGVEQKYNSIKFQYEERIKELELQLSIYQGQTEHTHPHTHAIALERELENVRERYKKQVAELQAEVDRLNTDVTKSRKNIETTLKSELQAAKETESELHSHIKSLQVEVESKQHDLEVMQKSLERLRKEKHLYMMNGVTNGENSRIPKAGVRSKKEEISHNSIFHSLPPEKTKGNDREYEPSTFADAHISDILQENEELRTKVDQLQLQLDQQRVEMRKSLAETEAVVRMSREEYEEQIQSLKASHQKELQKILAEHALKQASSRTAELQSKADTQEVVIRHLKEQLAKAEVELEQVAVLRIRQATLEMQLMKCEEELREAKKCHTPEMRHFEALQGKITQIEKKHEYREQELQQVIKNAQHAAKADLDQEVQKWKKIVEVKNNEIQKFRMELDSILEVLRVLQKQGVIIPVGPEVS
ncbi:hypothetical protein CHS0354_033733 [Potamilus streckersoni]|uniref:Centrosomal protein of 162 kDa n=1 Tax=Potamilus streckersoni TaxID=2493646 RepID=A0AAE0S2N1_9BIVA|nr:hypothetical protein CHS0354_033733 [Potamilus streckersoni]